MSKNSFTEALQRLIKFLSVEKFRCKYCGKLVLTIPKSHPKECKLSPNHRHDFITVHR